MLNMSDLVAKPIVKNKFWVVEDSGEKIATIQARDDGGFVYVHDDQREYFSSVQSLKKTYNIKFGTAEKTTKAATNHVYGFPVSGKSYNQVWDVQKRLPIYTKMQKSRSFFCAGYYLVKLNTGWTVSYCPKNITLNRYEYHGPYHTKDQATDILKDLQ